MAISQPLYERSTKHPEFKVRILAITNLYPNPYHTGRATFNRQQFKALAEEHAFRVISPISWVDELKARAGGEPALPAGRRLERDGIPIEHPRYYYLPRGGRRWFGRCFAWSIRRTFERSLREFQPDVVFAPWIYPDGWAAVKLGHAAGLPVILKAHGCDVLVGGEGIDRHPSRRQGTVEALQEADGVVAVSEHLADTIGALGVPRSQVHVVTDGINTELFKPGSRTAASSSLGMQGQPPMILFVGNLLPVKGVDVLIDACQILNRQGVDFICRLVGEGSLRAVLERETNRMGLGHRVQLMGQCQHDRLPDWFRAAAVSVLPSRSEGLPCVLLEASACGTPFVASNVGGIPEIARLGTNWLVPATNADALAAALKSALEWSAANPTRTAHYTKTHRQAAWDLAQIFGEASKFHAARVAPAERINKSFSPRGSPVGAEH